MADFDPFASGQATAVADRPEATAPAPAAVPGAAFDPFASGQASPAKAPEDPMAHWRNLFSGLEGIDSRVTPEQSKAISQIDRISDKPEHVRAAVVNQAFIKERVGMNGPMLDQNWGAVKSAFVKKEFGLDLKDVDEQALYQMIGNKIGAPRADKVETGAIKPWTWEDSFVDDRQRAVQSLSKFWESINASPMKLPEPPADLPDVAMPGLYPVSPAVAAGLYKGFKPLLEGAVSPLGIATVGAGGFLGPLAKASPLARGALRGMSGIFGALMGYSAARAAPETLRTLRDPNASTQTKVAALTENVATSAAALAGTLHAALGEVPERAPAIAKAMEDKTPTEAAEVLRRAAATAAPDAADALNRAATQFEEVGAYEGSPQDWEAAGQEKIKAAAIRTPDGRVNEGQAHEEIRREIAAVSTRETTSGPIREQMESSLNELPEDVKRMARDQVVAAARKELGPDAFNRGLRDFMKAYASQADLQDTELNAEEHADQFEDAFSRLVVGKAGVLNRLTETPGPVGAEEGFVTTSGRFVDRVEARQIASEAGQIISPEPETETVGAIPPPEDLHSHQVQFARPRSAFGETSLKNAAADLERVAYGFEDAPETEQRDMAERWARSEEVLREDPKAGERLAAQLKSNPNLGLSDDQSALLLRHKVDLQKALNAAADVASDPGSTPEARTLAREQMAEASNALQSFNASLRLRGAEWGREGRWRQALAREDYSFASQEMLLRAAKGSELTPEETKGLQKRVRELEAKQLELETAIAKQRIAPTRTTERRTTLLPPKARAALASAADEARKRIIARAGQLNDITQAFVDAPETVKDLAIVAADHLARYADDATAAAEAMVKELGEWVRPHVEKAIKAGRELLDQTSRPKQTDTPTFKAWFKDSKVVDAQGNPKVVYHGTGANFRKFNLKKTTQGIIWFTSDRAKIDAGEVGAAGNGRVMEMFASIQNPAGWAEYDKLGLYEFKGRGLDGAILPDGNGGFDGFVFKSEQLKSVTKNTGAFNTENPDITDAKGPAFTDRILTDPRSAPPTKTVWLSDAGRQAMDRLMQRVERGAVRYAVDPGKVEGDVLTDLATVGGDLLYSTGVNFAKWSARMVAELGEQVRPHLEAVWGRAKEVYRATVAENMVGGAGPNGPANLPRVALQLARGFIEDGLRDRDAVVKAVHEVVSKNDPALTPRDVADAISGYGKFKPLSKDQIDAELRDIKGQLLQVAKLEDMAAGQAPKKTGPESGAPSDEQRRLIQQVEAEKKKGGYVVTDPEKQLRTALDAIKKRLTNQISDFEKQIATGEKIVKEKRTVALDSEAELLKARRDALREQFDSVFGPRKLTEQQRLNIFKAFARRRVDELQTRLAEKDFEPKQKRPAPPLDEEGIQIKQELERLKQDFAVERAKAEEAAKPAWQRAMRTTTDLARASALSGYHVFGKLASFSLWRFGERPVTEGLGALIRQLPGVEEIATKANLESGAEFESLGRFYGQAATRGMRDALETLQTGKSGLKAELGEHRLNVVPVRWYDYFGIGHMATKSPLLRGAFELHLEKAKQAAIAAGIDVTDPLVDGAMRKEAFDYAERTILQEKNVITDMINAGMRVLDKTDAGTGEISKGKVILSTLIKTFVTKGIVRVPPNYVLQTLERTPLGLAKGATQAVWANVAEQAKTRGWRWAENMPGVAGMSEAEANTIIRLFKVGGVGTGIFVWGMIDSLKAPKDRMFGGYYQPGDKRGQDDVPWGQIRIGNVTIPHLFTHNPMYESGQMGSTMMRVAMSRLSKKDAKEKGYISGFLASLLAISSEAPIVNPIMQSATKIERGQADSILDEELAGLVPQLVQNVAQDLDGKSRKATGLKETMELTIPVVRENVPETKAQKKRDIQQRFKK